MHSTDFLISLIISYNSLIRKASNTLGISLSQTFNILSIPFDGIPMSQLSHKLGLDASTLTRNVNKLIKLGFINKTIHHYDKRVQLIILTSNGTTFKKKILNKFNDLNHNALSQLSIDDKEMMHFVIEKLAWTLECDRDNN